MLSVNKDIVFKISLELSLFDLYNFWKISDFYKCDSKVFWILKLKKDYPELSKNILNPKEEYIEKIIIKLLKEISNTGFDESCYKHILHALTALYYRGNWEKSEDYLSPGGKDSRERATPYWNKLQIIFEQIGKEKFDEFIKISNYSCHYRKELYCFD
jgi:hypothetical protein